MATRYLGDDISFIVNTDRMLDDVDVAVAISCKYCGKSYDYEIENVLVSEKTISVSISAEESKEMIAGSYTLVIKTDGRISAVSENFLQLKEHCLKSKFV